jgi:2-polyprenyl-3-methyl-5-hydroxy-6-metoxy-1,4-benzoquinol methylase
MSPATQARLLSLNREFYRLVAGEFDRTRQGLPKGMLDLAARLADRLAASLSPSSNRPLRVLDAGCGNGRFARALAEVGVACNYTGIDADPHLLHLAREQTADLPGVIANFAAIDLSEPQWTTLLPQREPFDAVVCLAVLHHFPGLSLRRRLVRDLGSLVAPHGILALSTWQFLTSERLADKQVEWSEIGVNPAEVEEGDALLPWNQGVHALRYVHQLDLDEVRSLADDAGLRLLDTFRADGKEGNLNLFALLGA